MSARDAILGRVRRSLGVSGTDTARRAAVADRLARSPVGVIPARGQLPHEEGVALFIRMAKLAHSTVLRLPPAQAPAAVAEALARAGVPLTVKTGTDPRLAALPWDSTPLEVRRGKPSPDDLAAVSFAESGIAETGTLVLLSGPDNPTLLSFLTVIHVIVVEAATIVGDPETAMATVQRLFGKGRMPRAVHFITGPSRSGDIEQTMYLGAHGPRSLIVLVLDR
jgi:L-lactate dehydrogenase complex protein LldG